jgi:hypothetical protein
MTLRQESIDLGRVTSELTRVFAGKPPIGYLLGKTALRDAVTRFLACSQLEAEQIVDTMISRGLLEYEGQPASEIDDLHPWAIRPAPNSR